MRLLNLSEYDNIIGEPSDEGEEIVNYINKLKQQACRMNARRCIKTGNCFRFRTEMVFLYNN